MSRRISKPKVRSGCLTCKLRRVKCDETKPECTRCINYWGSCDGYANNITNASTSIITRPTILLPRIQPRISPSFESEQDHRYFEVFRNDATVCLGGVFDSYVWKRIVPQACAEERFLQDAAIAVGALVCAMHDIQRQKKLGNEPTINRRHWGIGTPDHVYAVARYGRSLIGMRKALLVEDKNIRTVLIACLLISCIEGFHGSLKGAVMQSSHTVKLLRGWLQKRGGSKSFLKSPAPEVIEDELIYLYSRIDLIVMTFLGPQSLEYHRASLQENEPVKKLPSVFLSLREARVHWDDITRRSLHFLAAAYRASQEDDLVKPPEQLPCKEVVKLDPDVSYLSLYKIPHWFKPQSDAYVEEVHQWEKAIEPLAIFFQQQNQQQLGQYSSPSSPPSPNPRMDVGHIGATILKVCGHTTYLLLTGPFFKDELSYDQLLPTFRSIYTLAASIYKPLTILNPRKHKTATSTTDNNNNNNHSYTFDHYVLPPLFVLVTRCRHRSLRRAAIRLLSSSHHRESIWDSLALARIGAWLMSIEERDLFTSDVGVTAATAVGGGSSDIEGIVVNTGSDGVVNRGDGGDDGERNKKIESVEGEEDVEEEEFTAERVVIPDHRRARITQVQVDHMKREAHIRCFQRASADAGDKDVVWSKAVLRW